MPHEYVRILENQKNTNRARYLDALKRDNPGAVFYDSGRLENGSDFLLKATLRAHDLEAYCDVLTKVPGSSSLGRYRYEPTLVVETYSISKEQKIELAFVGHVLGQVQGKTPVVGRIIGADEKLHVKLGNSDEILAPLLNPLQEWARTLSPEQPPLILNKHCPTCQFQSLCQAKAEQENNITLLDGVTAKVLRQYEKKGIFTVKQLSYLFKPRRRKKRSRKPPPLTHKLELQALAMRERKIYLQEMPELPRKPTELFLDLEGIPDQQVYYLFGLLVCEGNLSIHHSFWADTAQDEELIWQQFLEKANQYPDAPIYHYGSYEPRAIETLGKRYDISTESIKNRLVNVNNHIYGRIYFPVRSNSLKDIGSFIGAKWSSPGASGLQSVAWRYRWEETQISDHKRDLIAYNEEDCRALKLVTEHLSKIGETADSQEDIDFADQPKKNATERGSEIHREFEQIRRYAHANYNRNRISIRPKRSEERSETKKGAPKGHQAYRRIAPSKPRKVVRVPMKRKCPKHKGESLQRSEEMAEKILVDLNVTQNGCRKTITKYVGTKGFCQRCCMYYDPPEIERLGSKLFGHGFQAWTIYQRIILRLPYRVITQVMEDLFGERTSEGTIMNFIRYFAQYYAPTEDILIQRILESPFIHVDETRLNIQGTDHYVWVFTDGKHVIFRMTETRETTIVHEFMSNYKGVLISDFYPGYDSVTCEQQKCLIHLIRDLNDDLWNTPFNAEFESFVFEVKNLIVPILEAVKKYGLKKRHLNKFKKSVEQFYKKNIADRDYKSEPTIKYQKRFQRYKNSLFTFLEKDSIPWNNNMAERAIRHLAVQRKISGTFFEHFTPQYLQLLGIAQTCRFQDKSFLKFLISKEKDTDKFRATKRLNISTPVGSPRSETEQ